MEEEDRNLRFEPKRLSPRTITDISAPIRRGIRFINERNCACGRSGFGPTYTKIGTIQRRLAWSLRKDDTH